MDRYVRLIAAAGVLTLAGCSPFQNSGVYLLDKLDLGNGATAVLERELQSGLADPRPIIHVRLEGLPDRVQGAYRQRAMGPNLAWSANRCEGRLVVFEQAPDGSVAVLSADVAAQRIWTGPENQPDWARELARPVAR